MSHPKHQLVQVRVAVSVAAMTTLAVLIMPAALGAPGAAWDGAPSRGRAQDTAVGVTTTGAHVVTLITGDRVRVVRTSDGHTQTTLLPRSPHLGGPVRTIATREATFFVPRLSPAQRTHLDLSLFNVTALAALTGSRVPVNVRFTPGTEPHAVPGLELYGTARQTAEGTISRASYPTARSASARGAAAGDATWRGVASVTLPTGGLAAAPRGKPKYTLTVHLVTGHGDPVKYADGFAVNVDDASDMKEISIVDGEGSVRVGEGNYCVIAGTFFVYVIAPDFAVTEDTTVGLNLADATTRPLVTVPGRSAVDATTTLQRDAAAGGGLAIDLGVSGAKPFKVRIQPVSASLPHGDMWTLLSASMVPSSEVNDRVFSTMAFTKDYAAGVPDEMSYTHPRSDFAVVPETFYATGPRGLRYDAAAAFAPFEYGVFTTLYPVHTPGVRPTWLQGDPDLEWLQDYWVISPRGDDYNNIADLTKFSRYSAGNAPPVRFARAPVGPGTEAGYDGDRPPRSCLLCRDGDHLLGYMPLIDGAGAGMEGYLVKKSFGSWSLNHAGQPLQTGHGVIAPYLTVPAERQGYTLHAELSPGIPEWQLSTDVQDQWWFASGAGDRTIPLLMPSYVPPTTLAGTVPPGRTHFRLDFGNLGPDDERVTDASLSLSTNGGKTWHAVILDRLDANSFGVRYTNPAATHTARTMSFRVVGLDAQQHKVVETAIDAYRLVAS